MWEEVRAESGKGHTRNSPEVITSLWGLSGSESSKQGHNSDSRQSLLDSAAVDIHTRDRGSQDVRSDRRQGCRGGPPAWLLIAVRGSQKRAAEAGVRWEGEDKKNSVSQQRGLAGVSRRGRIKKEASSSRRFVAGSTMLMEMGLGARAEEPRSSGHRGDGDRPRGSFAGGFLVVGAAGRARARSGIWSRGSGWGQTQRSSFACSSLGFWKFAREIESRDSSRRRRVCRRWANTGEFVLVVGFVGCRWRRVEGGRIFFLTQRG